MVNCGIFFILVWMVLIGVLAPFSAGAGNLGPVGAAVTGKTNTIALTDTGWSGLVSASDCVKGWADTQWSLTLTRAYNVTVDVADLGCPGDYFKVYGGGALLGATRNYAPPWGCDYTDTLSSGSFTKRLGPGTYLIQIRDAGFDGHSKAGIAEQRMCPAGFSAAITVQSIRPKEVRFNWGPGSSAIALKQRVSHGDQTISAPEYIDGTRNNPAAYPGNTALTVKVKFEAKSAAAGVTIWAEGSLGGLPKQVVSFGGGTTSSEATFTAPKRLPGGAEVTTLAWNWKYRIGSGPVCDMGQTSHTVYTTYRAPLSAPVYAELMGWTSSWAKNMTNDKQVVDGIIRNIGKSGLTYGKEAWTTATMLDMGGGMCGGWSAMFADMAGAQGVALTKKCFILRNDAAPSPEVKWNGIVVRAAGLNLKEPVTDPGVWRDVDRKAAYPYPLYLGDSSTRDDVTMVTERRWIFYSPYDGHCIDFLEYGGKVYLYDPSFGTGPFNNTFTSVPNGSMTGAALANFRKYYHDKAVDYMNGVIKYRSCATCTPAADPSLYLDVKTVNVPPLRDNTGPETFEIHYIWY